MATHAIGTRILIGANAISELTEIGGVEISADTLDTTNLDVVNGYRTFIAGLKDAGEVSLSGHFAPGDTNGQAALLGLLNSGASSSFTIAFPSSLGASWTFSGIVTGFTTGASMEDIITFEATIKISGKPDLATVAGDNLTGLALTGTGGSLSPAFNGANYNYTFSGVTASSVTVTATLAGATLSLYVDDVFVQSLTSGSASSAISLSTNVGKKITVVASAAGKSPKIYEVIAVKTA